MGVYILYCLIQVNAFEKFLINKLFLLRRSVSVYIRKYFSIAIDNFHFFLHVILVLFVRKRVILLIKWIKDLDMVGTFSDR